tara:strand:+ start:627 stop:869 length:243 start_codon:yes stop_codon:yes gene_type:complete
MLIEVTEERQVGLVAEAVVGEVLLLVNYLVMVEQVKEILEAKVIVAVKTIQEVGAEVLPQKVKLVELRTEVEVVMAHTLQ